MANKYLRSHASPTAGSESTIYDVPSGNLGLVSSLRITNTATSVALLNVRVFPSDTGNTYYILKSHVLAPNSTMDAFSGVSIVLEEGDQLKISSSIDGVDFYLSYLEVDRN